MEDKISKLQEATRDAKEDLEKRKIAFEASEEAVAVAKLLLRELTQEEQERITVTETKLPELLANYQICKDAYETSLSRYETNKKYLEKMNIK